MPSCVVKWCKNNSTSQKKCQGITYHRFPTGNDPWNSDWVSIIRNCRGEVDWIPSKTSVICSIHFDANDLYTTKNGLCRVVTYAVPKRLLYEPLNMQKQPADPKPFSSLRRVRRHQPSSSEASDSQCTTLSLQQLPLTIGTVAADFQQPSSSKAPLSTTLTFPQPPPTNGVTAADFLQPSLSDASASLSSALYIPQPSPIIFPAPPEASNFAQPLSFDTPRKLNLKEKLKKTQILIENNKKKIKTLNQKVRRLRKRNKSLKDILKTRKRQSYVDTDLFNRLNQNTAAADLFNNYNRKQLKKKIKFSQAIKKFSLTLNFYSPKAYDYMRKTFDTSCLPHRKTLAKWCGHVKGDPELTEESSQVLKAKAEMS